jgi:hypothetical protein
MSQRLLILRSHVFRTGALKFQFHIKSSKRLEEDAAISNGVDIDN